MWRAIKIFKNSHRQTKFFVFTLLLYMIALIWTTLQAYARLEYSRTDMSKTIIINANTQDGSP
jgi:hypothetical protein